MGCDFSYQIGVISVCYIHLQTCPDDKVRLFSSCGLLAVVQKCERRYKIVGETYIYELVSYESSEEQDFVLC